MRARSASRAARRLPRPGPAPLRRNARGLPRRPQGVLLAHPRGSPGRPDPPARFRVRGRRVPRRGEIVATPPLRRRRHRLGLPRAWRVPSTTRPPGSLRSTSAPKPWPSPEKMPKRSASPTASTFRQGDLLEPVAERRPVRRHPVEPSLHPDAVIPTLEPGVRDYEPHSALDGGADGLRIVSPLIAEAVTPPQARRPLDPRDRLRSGRARARPPGRAAGVCAGSDGPRPRESSAGCTRGKKGSGTFYASAKRFLTPFFRRIV